MQHSSRGHAPFPLPGFAAGTDRHPYLNAAAGPRRDRLRQATAAAHRESEARLAAAGSFGSLDGYGRYLAAIAPLYMALEAALDAAEAASLVADWPRRRKAGLLLADLRALGVAGAAWESGNIPALSIRLPQPWDAGTVLAVLYVLEGATLGGAVLARHMRRFGVTRSRGGGFLDPYGPERGAMWRGFLLHLESAGLTAEEEGSLGPRAVATFALFAERIATLLPVSSVASEGVPHQ